MFARRSRCARAQKSVAPSPRLLRCEQLESRSLLSAISPLSNPYVLAPFPGGNSTTSTATGPTVAKAASANVNSAGDITGTSAALAVLGSDPQGASTLIYNWTVTAAPGGGAARFSVNGSNAAQNDTVTFTEAGVYTLAVTIVDKSGLSVASSVKVTVVQTLTSVSLYSGSAKTLVNSGTQLKVTGTSQTLSVAGADQFGYPMAAQPSFTWTAITYPSGGKPSLSNVSGLETVTFNMAGAYGITAALGAGSTLVSTSANILVSQTLTSIFVTPGSASIKGGATQQFTALGLDQFQQAMASAPAFTWSASSGSISSTGLFTAPNTAGTDTITAKNGSLAGSATATVSVPTPAPAPSPGPGGLKDPVLASLVASLDAGGSLNRAAMITILTSVGPVGGTLSATDFADLKTILANAKYYNMPNYVQVLANDVVNGNAANATYQGAPLGNLAAGSSTAVLTKLIDKWFYGTDLPALTSTAFTYTKASGSLFPTTPSIANEFQGQLGDCYFISSLGTIADTNPAAIENMFINNGDGTYTVRFYTGTYAAFYNSNGTVSDGFLNNACTADYVTVNLSLPTYSNGLFAYADFGFSAANPSNSLWIPLAEKAYAQWNATGNEGRNGQNSYNAMQGGWMATVDAQVLGHNATDYNVTASTEQAMITALGSNLAVTIATNGSNVTDGLYADHAYAVIGYNAGSGLFTLYNPWGFDQPGGLTWREVEANTGGYVVANAAGSVPISAVASGVSTSPSATTNLRAAAAAWITVPAAASASSGTPAATDNSSDNHRASIFCDGSANEASIARASQAPAPAGVDAVLASQDLGNLFAG